jgi:hypothetical protein
VKFLRRFVVQFVDGMICISYLLDNIACLSGFGRTLALRESGSWRREQRMTAAPSLVRATSNPF